MADDATTTQSAPAALPTAPGSTLATGVAVGGAVLAGRAFGRLSDALTGRSTAAAASGSQSATPASMPGVDTSLLASAASYRPPAAPSREVPTRLPGVSTRKFDAVRVASTGRTDLDKSLADIARQVSDGLTFVQTQTQRGLDLLDKRVRAVEKSGAQTRTDVDKLQKDYKRLTKAVLTAASKGGAAGRGRLNFLGASPTAAGPGADSSSPGLLATLASVLGEGAAIGAGGRLAGGLLRGAPLLLNPYVLGGAAIAGTLGAAAYGAYQLGDKFKADSGLTLAERARRSRGGRSTRDVVRESLDDRYGARTADETRDREQGGTLEIKRPEVSIIGKTMVTIEAEKELLLKGRTIRIEADKLVVDAAVQLTGKGAGFLSAPTSSPRQQPTYSQTTPSSGLQSPVSPVQVPDRGGSVQRASLPIGSAPVGGQSTYGPTASPTPSPSQRSVRVFRPGKASYSLGSGRLAGQVDPSSGLVSSLATRMGRSVLAGDPNFSKLPPAIQDHIQNADQFDLGRLAPFADRLAPETRQRLASEGLTLGRGSSIAPRGWSAPSGSWAPPNYSPQRGGIDRSSFLQELRDKPWLEERLATMVRGEVGLSDKVPLDKKLIQLESVFNRSQVRGHSLERGLWSTSEHGSRGYYPSSTYARSPTAAEMESFRRDVLPQVLAGSDRGSALIGSPVTGNASQGVAARGAASGRYGNAWRYYGDNPRDEMYVTHSWDQRGAARLPRLGDSPERVASLTPPGPEVTRQAPTPSPPVGDYRPVGGRGYTHGVDPRLTEIINAAAQHLPEGYRLERTSGLRPGDSGYHGRGHATDYKIIGPDGEAIRNRGEDHTGMYTLLARHAYGEQMARYPELAGRLGSGINFGTQKGGGGERDLMHLDLGGDRGRRGPSLASRGAIPGELYGTDFERSRIATLPPARTAVAQPAAPVSRQTTDASRMPDMTSAFMPSPVTPTIGPDSPGSKMRLGDFERIVRTDPTAAYGMTQMYDAGKNELRYYPNSDPRSNAIYEGGPFTKSQVFGITRHDLAAGAYNDELQRPLTGAFASTLRHEAGHVGAQRLVSSGKGSAGFLEQYARTLREPDDELGRFMSKAYGGGEEARQRTADAENLRADVSRYGPLAFRTKGFREAWKMSESFGRLGVRSHPGAATSMMLGKIGAGAVLDQSVLQRMRDDVSVADWIRQGPQYGKQNLAWPATRIDLSRGKDYGPTGTSWAPAIPGLGAVGPNLTRGVHGAPGEPPRRGVWRTGFAVGDPPVQPLESTMLPAGASPPIQGLDASAYRSTRRAAPGLIPSAIGGLRDWLTGDSPEKRADRAVTPVPQEPVRLDLTPAQLSAAVPTPDFLLADRSGKEVAATATPDFKPIPTLPWPEQAAPPTSLDGKRPTQEAGSSAGPAPQRPKAPASEGGGLEHPSYSPESAPPTPGSDGYGSGQQNPDGRGICSL